jgi:SNF2 family DNA or RNA helicase
VDGSVSSTKRNDVFHHFQNSRDPHVLLANAGTMAHGLNLTAASTIVWYAPTNNNDTFNQANARIVRPGQKNVTNIVHMYATPVERKTYQALRDKTKLQDIVLDLARMG